MSIINNYWESLNSDPYNGYYGYEYEFPFQEEQYVTTSNYGENYYDPYFFLSSKAAKKKKKKKKKLKAKKKLKSTPPATTVLPSPISTPITPTTLSPLSTFSPTTLSPTSAPTLPSYAANPLIAQPPTSSFLPTAAAYPVVPTSAPQVLQQNIPSDAVFFGGAVQLKGLATRWPGFDGYLSPCNWWPNEPNCGANAALRPDASFKAQEPNSNLRNWTILGAIHGQPLRYGDVVQIKGTAIRWRDHSGYLAPCGQAGAQNCGNNVSLIPEIESDPIRLTLRNWQILGGPIGQFVRFGDILEIKCVGGVGNEGFLSPCNDPLPPDPTGCGVNVTLRPDASFNREEPDSLLRKWQIIRPTS